MTKDDSSKAAQTGEIVAGGLALASLIFVDTTALHFLFGIPLLLYSTRNFSMRSCNRDRVILSMVIAIALLLIFSPILHPVLNKFGWARFWDVILLVLGIVISIVVFFVKKHIFEHRNLRGAKMKKAAVFLVIGMGLIVLLGLAKSSTKPQIDKPECEPTGYWQKVNEYKIIHEPNLPYLKDEVKKGLNHGWYPIGGISIVGEDCCQVMIR